MPKGKGYAKNRKPGLKGQAPKSKKGTKKQGKRSAPLKRPKSGHRIRDRRNRA